MITTDLREIVLSKGDTSIGAVEYPDRKRPAIIVRHGNSDSVFGYFKNIKCARLFMNELAELVGAKKEDDHDH
jgi:hypothetical protein